eukprot:1643428-Amphidinium_carterae.1
MLLAPDRDTERLAQEAAAARQPRSASFGLKLQEQLQQSVHHAFWPGGDHMAMVREWQKSRLKILPA